MKFTEENRFSIEKIAFLSGKARELEVLFNEKIKEIEKEYECLLTVSFEDVPKDLQFRVVLGC